MKIKKHNIFLLLFIVSYVAVLPIVFTEMYKNSGFGELFAAPDDKETTDGLEVIDGREENPGDITETPPISTPENPTSGPALKAYDESACHHEWKEKFGGLIEKKTIFDYE